MDCLNRLYRGLKCLKLTKSVQQIRLLSKYNNLNVERLVLNQSGELSVKETDITIVCGKTDFLLNGLTLVHDLQSRIDARFTNHAGGQVLLTVGGVRLLLSCWEELFIAHEVFYRGVYNLRVNQHFSVIDVGMNTGTTALFYAVNPLCTHVSGFELFTPTAQRAKQNLALNPEISEKITMYEYGLGAEDQTLELEYFPDLKGSVGTAGLPSYAHAVGAKPESYKVKAVVRSAGPVIERLLRETCPGLLVCKLDCEGSEYDIIRTLAKGDLLRKVSVFMIEWHLRGPEEIKKILIANGFTCLSFDEHAQTHGMLYAFGERGVLEKKPRASNLVDADIPNA
jgi:FkbM family methyltransferase